MTDTEVAVMGRIIAIEAVLIGLVSERVAKEATPAEAAAHIRDAIRSSAQNARWDTKGIDQPTADAIWEQASSALDYLFARIGERVRSK